MKCFKRPWSRREELDNILEATHGSAIEKYIIEVPFVPNKLQVHYPMGPGSRGSADCSDVMHNRRIVGVRSSENVAESSVS
jgi:hypothetical protein